MNKLEILERVLSKSGLSYTIPTTTTGMTGVEKQAAGWVDDAYEGVQRAHPTWQFLREDFSQALTIGKASYTPTELGLTDWGEFAPDDWRVFLLAADEGGIVYQSWDLFRMNYQIGTYLTQTGRPFVYSIDPDDNIVLFPIPDQVYTLKGEYFVKPYVMTDSDAPVWSSAYHMIVVWRAIMYYGAEFGDADKYNSASDEHRIMLRQMEKKYLPSIRWGRPLV
jgi:hypothetical protein